MYLHVASNTVELCYDVIQESFRTQSVDVASSKRTMLQVGSAIVVLIAVSVALETALLASSRFYTKRNNCKVQRSLGNPVRCVVRTVLVQL